MQKALLIADSGGTKTDWCLMDQSGNKTFFTTKSYHPIVMSEDWIKLEGDFWKDFTDKYALSVRFYGSGCLNKTNQEIVKQAFKTWKIKDVLVESDLLGAARASYQDGNGLIAIMGTGSVIAEIKNSQLIQLNGGLGYLIGDEGSGYYFGKMILSSYLRKEFDAEINAIIEKHVGDRDSILKKIYQKDGREFLSSIPLVLSNATEPLFRDYHNKNIALFLHYYLPKKTEHKRLTVLGSYGFNMQEYIRDQLAELDWDQPIFIERPISKIADYHSFSSL